MSLAAFDFTDRARPVVQIGVGDSRTPAPLARWDTARWDNPAALWSGTEPTWLDVTCDTISFACAYGRQRTIDQFVPGLAQVIVDNATGWADPNATVTPGVLGVRPGRAIRMGVSHDVYGVRWLFRGFIDAMTPTYDPADPDTVQLDCIDALGEVNRAKTIALVPPVGAGETINQRVGRILNLAAWPAVKRDLSPASDTLLASDMGGQIADLLGQAADSGGGSVFGDLEARVAFRPRDWQAYMPGTAPDGTIGNVAPGDVCPVQWERPFARADITTRVIIGRDADTAITLDDVAGQAMYGIEPFERVDLLTQSDTMLTFLGNRILRIRSAASAPRIRSVSLDASTADNALDLMTTVDVYRPSRYRCRLLYDRGTVFDAEHFATGVAHQVSRDRWSLNMNLDLAAPFAYGGGRWDQSGWDQATWTNAALLEEMTA